MINNIIVRAGGGARMSTDNSLLKTEQFSQHHLEKCKSISKIGVYVNVESGTWVG